MTDVKPGRVSPDHDAARGEIAAHPSPGADATPEPGLVITLHRTDGPSHSTSRGFASIEHGIRAGQDSVFNLASVSKQFTATCAVLLHLQGRIDLDADVRAIIPELRFPVPFSLRQCLTHTAGLPDVLGLINLTGASVATFPDNHAMLRLLFRLRDLECSPGSHFSYSNSGYIVAATVMERVTGEQFADVARRLIFQPLGMTSTRFFTHPGETIPRAATGYTPITHGWRRCDLLEFAVGAGGASSCAADMHAWHEFLTDGRILGQDARDELITPSRLSTGENLPYALGTIHEQLLPDHRVIGHGGALRGIRCHVLTDLSTGVGVTVLANRDDVVPGEIARQSLLEELGAGTAHSATGPANAWAPSRETLGSVGGHWWCVDTDEILTVRALPDTRPAGSITVETPWGESVFRPAGARTWSSGSEQLTLCGAEIAWRGEVGELRTFVRLQTIWRPDADLLQRLPGHYWCAELGTDLEISSVGESLMVRFGLGESQRLIAKAPELFGCGPVMVRVTQDEDRLSIGGYGNSNRGRLDYRRFHPEGNEPEASE